MPENGRPSKYSTKLADDLCERLIDGESLRKICLSESMPSVATVCRWLADDKHPGFREQYARAREFQADTLFDEVLNIADTADEKNEAVALARLKIDARKWMAGKLRAKKYGDKLQLDGEISLNADAKDWLGEDD